MVLAFRGTYSSYVVSQLPLKGKGKHFGGFGVGE